MESRYRPTPINHKITKSVNGTPSIHAKIYPNALLMTDSPLVKNFALKNSLTQRHGQTRRAAFARVL
jgi:hypothetical protein